MIPGKKCFVHLKIKPPPLNVTYFLNTYNEKLVCMAFEFVNSEFRIILRNYASLTKVAKYYSLVSWVLFFVHLQNIKHINYVNFISYNTIYIG